MHFLYLLIVIDLIFLVFLKLLQDTWVKSMEKTRVNFVSSPYALHVLISIYVLLFID
jgi:hypothetical protein